LALTAAGLGESPAAMALIHVNSIDREIAREALFEGQWKQAREPMRTTPPADGRNDARARRALPASSPGHFDHASRVSSAASPRYAS